MWRTVLRRPCMSIILSACLGVHESIAAVQSQSASMDRWEPKACREVSKDGFNLVGLVWGDGQGMVRQPGGMQQRQKSFPALPKLCLEARGWPWERHSKCTGAGSCCTIYLRTSRQSCRCARFGYLGCRSHDRPKETKMFCAKVLGIYLDRNCST